VRPSLADAGGIGLADAAAQVVCRAHGVHDVDELGLKCVWHIVLALSLHILQQIGQVAGRQECAVLRLWLWRGCGVTLDISAPHASTCLHQCDSSKVDAFYIGPCTFAVRNICQWRRPLQREAHRVPIKAAIHLEKLLQHLFTAEESQVSLRSVYCA
jgi:hypothetical protein